MDETTGNTREALIDGLDRLARETSTSPDEMEAAAREWAEYERWKEAMVQEALDDIEAGDEGRPAEEVSACGAPRAICGASPATSKSIIRRLHAPLLSASWNVAPISGTSLSRADQRSGAGASWSSQHALSRCLSPHRRRGSGAARRTRTPA